MPAIVILGTYCRLWAEPGSGCNGRPMGPCLPPLPLLLVLGLKELALRQLGETLHCMFAGSKEVSLEGNSQAF